MSSPATAESADLLLATIQEDGPPPDRRITKVSEADSLYRRLYQDDLTSSRNRARIDAMCDGEPPLSQAELNATGQGNRANLNFGGAAARLEYATVSYLDLINSVSTLATVKLKDEAGELAEREYAQSVIAEEFTRMLRTWPGFNYTFENTVRSFIKHGVSIAMFDDPLDWRWHATSLNDVKVPRMTSASSHDIEVLCSLRRYQAHELWAKIENPEVAKKMGWNVSAVRKAISKACTGKDDWDDYERIAAQFKNNDISMSARASEIKLAHVFVREFDGTISQLAFEPTAVSDKSEFLFESRNMFTDPHDLYTIYTYGIGTNGMLHSVRGLGHAIYNYEQVINRVRCQQIDVASIANLVVRATSEDAMEDLQYIVFGGMTVLPQGLELVPNAIPNQNNTLSPVLQDIAGQLDAATGIYMNQNLTNQGSREMTRFEAAANMEQRARLSVGALNLFYSPWDRTLRTSLKRATSGKVTSRTPGGAEVAKFIARCEARGVPKELLKYIDHDDTRAVRSVGAGSAAQRTVALERLREFYGMYDDTGRQNLLYDLTAAVVGTDVAERYAARKTSQREPADLKIALLENAQLEQGIAVPVLTSERHFVHLDAHMAKMGEILQIVNQGQMQLEDALTPLMTLQTHTVEHYQQVEQDPMMQEQLGQIRQAIQQADEIINNAQTKVAAMQRKAMAEQEANGGQPMEGGDPESEARSAALDVELQGQIAKHQLQLQLMQEKAQMQMSIEMAKAEQRRRIEDAKQAVNLRKFLPTAYPQTV